MLTCASGGKSAVDGVYERSFHLQIMPLGQAQFNELKVHHDDAIRESPHYDSDVCGLAGNIEMFKHFSPPVSSVIILSLIVVVGCSKPHSETTTPDSDNTDDEGFVEEEETRQIFLRFTDNVSEQITEYYEAPEEWDQLFLTGSPVEDSLMRSLPVRTDIEVLDLSQTPVTQETIELIPEKFPNLRILYCDFTAVTSPSPLLGMSGIKRISFYGTFAEASQITRRDGERVIYFGRQINRESLRAIRSLTRHNIIISPVVFSADQVEYTIRAEHGLPTEYIEVSAWDDVSAAANGSKPWDGVPEGLAALKDISLPMKLYIQFPFELKAGKLYPAPEVSEAFYAECLTALRGCKNIVGLSLVSARIDLSQWVQFIEILDVKMADMSFVQYNGNSPTPIAQLVKDLDSLLFVELSYWPDRGIQVSDLLSFPSLRIIVLKGDHLKECEADIARLAEHPTLKVIDLPFDILSDETEKKFEDHGIQIVP